MAIRALSYSEMTTAMTCQAQWDFSYGGRLAGSTLKPRFIKPIFSEGRAWGAALAAWHANSGTLLAGMEAMSAMRASLEADWKQMAKAGVMMSGVLDKRADMEQHLAEVFSHYTSLCDPLPNLTRIEGELNLPIPSRTGKRSSSRYHFQGFLDGFVIDGRGEWLWECKLRSSLTSRNMIELGRQYLEYAWARQRETGRPIVGIIVEERLNHAPKPVSIVQAKKGEGREDADGKWHRPSHKVDQLTTPELYLAACTEYGVAPQPETLEYLRGRNWQERHYIPFRASELHEAGQELVSAARLIGQLDRGELYPFRNAQATNCNMCHFKRICKNPRDDLFVDQIFTRGIPKRDKLPRPSDEKPTDGVDSGTPQPETSASSTNGDTVPTHPSELEDAPF